MLGTNVAFLNAKKPGFDMTSQRGLILSLLMLIVSLTQAGQIALTDVSIARTDSLSYLEVHLQNKSTSLLRILLWADVYDLTGKYQGRIESGGREIPSLSQASYRFSLSTLTNGIYKALVVGQYYSEDSNKLLRASTLLMEYIAPFEFSGDFVDANYVIRDQIDAPNSREHQKSLSVNDQPASQHVNNTAIESEKNTMAISEEQPSEASQSQNLAMETADDESVYYTVRSGDWLSKLAKLFYGDKTKFMAIFEANRNVLSDPNILFPGQKLKIPLAEYFSYSIKPDDRLSSIAAESYGDSHKFTNSLSANSQRLKNQNQIVPDEVLIILPLKSEETPAIQLLPEERTPGDFWDEYEEVGQSKRRAE